MKVAIISTNRRPLPPVLGGAVQIYIDGMIPYLRDECDLTVLSARHDPLPAYEAKQGVVYHRFSREEYELSVYRHLADHDYDILHLFNRPRCVYHCHKVSPKSKIILSLHNELLAKNKLSYSLGRRTVEMCDAIVTISRYIGKTVVSRFPEAKEKTFPVYSAVDSERFQPHWLGEKGREERRVWRRRLGVEDRKVILYVGRLTPEKGPHLLLRAVKLVIKEEPEALLLIVGGDLAPSDRFHDHLRKEAKELAGNVRFAGFIPPAQLPAYYAAADVFVCPSQWEEPLARVHFEAMAAGLPIITTQRGGNGEVIEHGRNGLLLGGEEAVRPEAFAREILRLLRHPAFAETLAREARRNAEQRYTFPRLARDILHLYRLVLQRKR
ncbi:glycosyltransferase family 4 protein [Bacillaceae bacterium]